MNDISYLFVFFTLLLLAAPFTGYYMAWILEAKSLPTEKTVFRYLGLENPKGQEPKEYLKSLIVFHLIGGVLLFLILSFQDKLPFNSLKLSGMDWDLALNTAISFITNTNWQAYSGESQLSYFSQAVGLTPQNFVSAGVGIAVLAFAGRAIASTTKQEFGNFWQDLYRSVFFILLPLSFILAILLLSQGVVQSFADTIQTSGFDGNPVFIPLGPVASQVSIKQLGTNGGGFFGVNSAHPFENPTPISNFLELFSILFLPAASVFLYGKAVGSFRHAWVVFFVMLALILLGWAVVYISEIGSVGYWEGKETRFSLAESSLWLSATSAASNGSVNSMHDSYSPLAGGVALFQIMIGEVIFGGVGAGMYGMLLFLVLTVFLSGLMTGRTPEYLGKKIESYDIKCVLVGILSPTVCILIGSAVTLMIDSGYSAKGPHALSQVLYAFSSASGNNGSAFAGFGADTVWGNLALGFCMLVGRFSVIASVILLTGNMGAKKTTEKGLGSFRTDSLLFGGLLLSVILIVAGLSFFPVLSLGPILEQILLSNGKLF
ncbi:potassium-transporting ATPase potassium-binding subunit [Leptospira kobayashii]|uniref:Potassium-transporting ATPase potassium-binding subunit n=1 Tax=Leptospira kobayashii TaxID=1917830 RepID=A0ABM7UR88_9LEPT|nr:potassium-transporting ATPase subunit KdpA [Leptospira kobayashii]BDA78494.1 potassium-transporting ATPase potassium-binding subunit [Leptospira kobayashii]